VLFRILSNVVSGYPSYVRYIQCPVIREVELHLALGVTVSFAELSFESENLVDVWQGFLSARRPDLAPPHVDILLVEIVSAMTLCEVTKEMDV
jgi:hypothetical protein